MDILINYIVPFVGMLVALIVIHEAGHYVTAKIFGIKVLEAGIGYPPRAWGFTWRGTIYSLNWIPLGGFVRLLGEEDPSDPQSLAAAAAWKRIVVLGSGATLNLILPIFLFAAVFMLPREVPTGPAMITGVAPESPAEQAGLEPGDIIVAVNDYEVKNSLEAIRETRLNQGERVNFTVKRTNDDGEVETLTVTAQSRWSPPPIEYTVQEGDDVRSVAELLAVSEGTVRAAAEIETALEADDVLLIQTDDGPIEYRVRRGDSVEVVANRLDVSREAVREAAGLPDPDFLAPGTELTIEQGPIGIGIGNQYPFTENEQYSVINSIPKGWEATWDTLILFEKQIEAMFHGGGGPDFAGPVGIAQTTGEVVKESGWKPLLELAALLSLNLGIINLLPVPMMDGGRITFVLIEIARRGRRIAPEKEAIVHLAGLVLILTMAVVITYFDVARLIAGDSLF